MTDSLHSSDGGNATRPPQRPRRVKFLAAWLVLLLAGYLLVWQSGATQDYKNAALQAAVVLAVIGAAVWTVRSSGLPGRARLLLALLLVAPLWAVSPAGPVELINNGNNGITGWRWRWSVKPDERLQAVSARPQGELDWQTTPEDYPRFLGGGYWAEVKGVDLASNWAATPPKELWRRAIGAGWSGFAVVGDYAITQEQRGPQEMVVCYEARTGKIVWTHADEARWDPSGGGALGGVGPRATPTVHEGRVYTHGATGILNCLDAATGKRLWSHDTLVEYNADELNWGKAGSPIIVDDMVVVSVGGTSDNSLVAFALEDGAERWAAGNFRSSYATPVLTELAGVRQVVVVNEEYVTSHRADDGEQLWQYPWKGNSDGNASASQPVPVGDDRIFLSKGYGEHAQLIQIARGEDDAWTTDQIWRKPVLRTKLGNVVIHQGYIYGIDDVDMQCVELATGKRQWKERRRPVFGHGQIILVGNTVLVLSESGELVLVEATPEKFNELASMQVLEGVTWNNPALSGELLLVRNAEEAACFEMPLAGGAMLAQEGAPAP